MAATQSFDNKENAIIEFLDPKNIYFDTKIIMLSAIEAEIWSLIGFNMAAILNIQYGRQK